MDYATKEVKRVEEEHQTKMILVFKILNKLEQRISKLEKVLESHAKCIGEMREGESKDAFINLMEKGERG